VEVAGDALLLAPPIVLVGLYINGQALDCTARTGTSSYIDRELGKIVVDALATAFGLESLPQRSTLIHKLPLLVISRTWLAQFLAPETVRMSFVALCVTISIRR